MPEEPEKTVVTTPRWRRSWKRWLANLMILAGVILLAWVPSTWAYTWFQQRDLKQQLEQTSPQITSSAASLSGTDFIPLAVKGENAQQAASTESTATSENAAATATATAATTAEAAAEAAHQAELDAFKKAADAFAASVSGKTAQPLGKIIIPSIGLNVVMVEGTGKGDLKVGPGHWPETPLPGEGGNFVVSGHRTTYGAPFFKLNKVEVGDEIDVVLPYAVARYTVTRIAIVLPTQMSDVAQVGKEQISLAACHPIYSAKQRIVVHGDLTSFKLISPQS
jgi:LPXTG-site transpeptidase (sortase) family protein